MKEKAEQPQEEIETKEVDNTKPAKVEETTSAKTETAQVAEEVLESNQVDGIK